jgi:hypothetical protein
MISTQAIRNLSYSELNGVAGAGTGGCTSLFPSINLACQN